MKEPDVSDLCNLAAQVRRYILIMNCCAGSGHPGGALSAADLMTYLFHRELNFSPANAEAPGRDRFVLSKGHSCPALYAVLAQKGFFGIEEFRGLRQVGGMLQGHPDRLKTPGVEFNSGSLAQGFSFAVGCALGGKRAGRVFRVYALLGDGELDEGQVWEALLFGAHHRLDNLVAIVDHNKLQSDDDNTKVLGLEPLLDKFRAFGWHTLEIDGHDFPQIGAAFAAARETRGRPTIIVAHTVKGKGISFMERTPKWHGSLAPQGEERAQALAELECQDLCQLLDTEHIA